MMIRYRILRKSRSLGLVNWPCQVVDYLSTAGQDSKLRPRDFHGGGLLRLYEKIRNLDVEGSGQFHDRREGRAAFAAENLRQVPFREIRLKIEAVERAVFLDHDLA